MQNMYNIGVLNLRFTNYKYHPNVTKKYVMSTTKSKKATLSTAEKKCKKKSPKDDVTATRWWQTNARKRHEN